MKTILFLAGLFIGQLVAYAVAGASPKVEYVEHPEVIKMQSLMASMPVVIRNTEPRDEIALLIERTK